MAGIGTGYDLSVSTFSPDGRVFQTEYAQKAVDNSGTVIGIVCKDGVVLGTQKYVISKMLEEHSNRRTFPIDRHAGAAIAGVAADGRAIVNRAQAEAANYKSFYGDAIPGHVLAERIASFMHVFNLYWYVRPMGVCVLAGAYDVDGPQLFLVDPAGSMHRYRGAAVGKGRQGAKNEIEKLNLEEMSCRDGIKAVAKILHQVHEEEKEFEMELAWICEESGKQFERVPADLVSQAEQSAKEALDADDIQACSISLPLDFAVRRVMAGPSRSLESDVRGSYSSTFEMMDSMERLYLPNEAEQSCPRVETSNCASARDSSRISSPASEILSIFHNARPDERLSPVTYSILPAGPGRSQDLPLPWLPSWQSSTLRRALLENLPQEGCTSTQRSQPNVSSSRMQRNTGGVGPPRGSVVFHQGNVAPAA